LRDGNGGDGAVGAAVFADESVGVGEDFVAGGGVEGSAFGVFDARVEIEGGFFGAAGIVDAIGAGEVILESSRAEFTMRSRLAGERSLEKVLAARWPRKTRTPMEREPDSFRVSTWPRRTSVENSSPSRTTHSAAVAPPFMAWRTMSWARERKSVSSAGSLVPNSVEGIKS
jgi:hypothetical protein